MDVKEKILKSALEIFINKGYYNARVEDIAEKAGIAKGTVYIYFKDKKSLFLSSIEYEIEKFYSELEKIIYEDMEPENRLKKLLKLIYDNLSKRRKYFESAIRLWPGELGEEIIKTILPHVKKITGGIEKVLKEGEKKSKFRSFDSFSSDSVILLGIVRSAAMSEVFFDKKVSFEKAWKYVKEILKIKKEE